MFEVFLSVGIQSHLLGMVILFFGCCFLFFGLATCGSFRVSKSHPSVECLGYLGKSCFGGRWGSQKNCDGLEAKTERGSREELRDFVSTKRPNPQGVEMRWEKELRQVDCSDLRANQERLEQRTGRRKKCLLLNPSLLWCYYSSLEERDSVGWLGHKGMEMVQKERITWAARNNQGGPHQMPHP